MPHPHFKADRSPVELGVVADGEDRLARLGRLGRHEHPVEKLLQVIVGGLAAGIRRGGGSALPASRWTTQARDREGRLDQDTSHVGPPLEVVPRSQTSPWKAPPDALDGWVDTSYLTAPRDAGRSPCRAASRTAPLVDRQGQRRRCCEGRMGTLERSVECRNLSPNYFGDFPEATEIMGTILDVASLGSQVREIVAVGGDLTQTLLGTRDTANAPMRATPFIFMVGMIAALAASSAMAEDTAVAEKDFRLTLPGAWIAQPAEDAGPWVYRSGTGNEQVTVSAVWNKSRVDSKTLKESLSTVVELHREASRKTGTSQLVLTPPVFGEVPGQGPFAEYVGVEPATRHQMVTGFFATPTVILIVLYESLGIAPKESMARGHSIFRSAKPLERTKGK